MKGKIRRWISGEVQLKAAGTQTARFAALLLKKGVFYRDLRMERGVLFLTIPVRDAKKTAAAAEKSGTRLETVRQTGLPAWKRRLHNRWVFLGAMTLSLVLMVLLSQRLWTIRIEGTRDLTLTEVLGRLEEHGIREGMWRWELDTEDKREELLLAYPDLSWLSLTMEGTCLRVRLAEATAGPGIQSRTQPADLVAAKTCIIYSIVTEKGTPAVQQGDVVQEGEPLIRGQVILTADDGTQTRTYVEARGEVYGKCFYELTEEIESAHREKTFGKSFRGLTLYWGNRRLSLRNPFRKEKTYDMEEMEIWAGLTGFLEGMPGLPHLSLQKAVYYPYAEQEAFYSAEEMGELLREKLERRKSEILEEKNGVLLAEELRLEETEEGCRGVLTLTVMEDVCKPVPAAREEEQQ